MIHCKSNYLLTRSHFQIYTRFANFIRHLSFGALDSDCTFQFPRTGKRGRGGCWVVRRQLEIGGKWQESIYNSARSKGAGKLKNWRRATHTYQVQMATDTFGFSHSANFFTNAHWAKCIFQPFITWFDIHTYIVATAVRRVCKLHLVAKHLLHIHGHSIGGNTFMNIDKANCFCLCLHFHRIKKCQVSIIPILVVLRHHIFVEILNGLCIRFPLFFNYRAGGAEYKTKK